MSDPKKDQRPNKDSLKTATLGPSSTPVSTSKTGAVIGNYRLTEKLGEGGMGEVYEAQQERPIRRKVAIKLIKAGMGVCLIGLGRYDEAESLLLRSFPEIKKKYSLKHLETKKTLTSIIKLYKEWDKPEEAEKYQKILQENKK